MPTLERTAFPSKGTDSEEMRKKQEKKALRGGVWRGGQGCVLENSLCKELEEPRGVPRMS